MRLHQRALFGIGLAWASCLPASAITVEPQDCREGADFVGNAARSRDNGLDRERFIDRLESDLVMLQSVPPRLRWFARDDDDAQLLRRWSHRVFSLGEPVDRLQREFLADCLAHAQGAAD